MFLGLRTWVRRFFHPILDALFCPGIPFEYRWRLILFQPASLLAYGLATTRYLFRQPFTVEYVRTDIGSWSRILVFKSGNDVSGRLRPIHLSLHGGAFIGGVPEDEAPFSARLAEETGAVVIVPPYRFAPRHPFPAAIDDVDAVVRYVQQHAKERWGADPGLLTISGSSAGGNLALAASLPKSIDVKASVTFYAAIELRLAPWNKPKPKNFPKKDPAAVFLPLYDAYADPIRITEIENPRLSPVIAAVGDLPRHMLLIVPGVDILVQEQRVFVERVKRDMEREGKRNKGRRVELLWEEKAFHGYLSLPDAIVPATVKNRAFDAGVSFIKDAHLECGWVWE